MNKLKYKIFCWFAWKHPRITSRIQDFSARVYQWRWQRYLKRHRCCCEDSLIRHCAEKLVVNSKKACCYAYLPERCEVCGRKIPRRILYKYMMLSSFLDELREVEEDTRVSREAQS